jgi:hypothetical protein
VLRETSFEETFRHFAGRSQLARRSWARWQRDAVEQKAAWLRGHRTRVPYLQTPDSVIGVAAASSHPLKDLKKPELAHYTRDWRPDFAFHFVFAYVTEALGKPPTWQEFGRFCLTDQLAYGMLGRPAELERKRLEGKFGIPSDQARFAVRWRVGIAYYSYMRELYCLAVLRGAGIDARTHPLADVLWRVDLWVDDLCVELFISNVRFKSSSGGRKPKPEGYIGDGPFDIVRVELPKQHKYGELHVPAPDDLLDAVRPHLPPVASDAPVEPVPTSSCSANDGSAAAS